MGGVRPVYIVAGVAVLGALAWALLRKGGAAGLGGAAASAAIGAADGAVGEAVNTIGEAVGIPRTNMSECEQAKARGSAWDASFACPAGDFLRYVFD